MVPTGLCRVLHVSRIRNMRSLPTFPSPKFMHSGPPIAGPSKQPSSQPTKTSKEESPAQKKQRAAVNNLLLGADRLLLTPRADTLTSYFMDTLSDAKFHHTYRAMAFMRSIRFCLERHLFETAVSLYDRMVREGFAPVRSLGLRMTALKVVHQATRLRETTDSLHKILRCDAYDLPAFMDLVYYLINDKDAPAAFVDDLAHTFVSLRGIKLSDCPDLVSEIASNNLRTNRLDAAHHWLKAFEDACAEEGVQPDVAPYSSIVNTINHVDPKNADAIHDVLRRMQSTGTPPDVVVINSLMRVNLVQHRYREVFALYDVLMQKRSEELSPNDVTFKILFRTTMRFSNPRTPDARRYGRPKNAVPPRRVFRDMAECHLERTDGIASGHSPFISVSALHLALRTFMALQDYAAAFALIRSLSLFGFQPNLQTYLIVFVGLLQRMKHEARRPRPEGTYRLADFLSNLRPDEDPDMQTLVDRIRETQSTSNPGPSPVGIHTITHFLNLGEPLRPSDNDLLDSTLYTSPSVLKRHHHSKVPTLQMLSGTDTDTDTNASNDDTDPRSDARSQTYFSPIPLARILQKALLGELWKKAVGRGEGWDWKGAAGKIVRETRREMIPEGVGDGDVGMDGGEKGMVREGILPYPASRIRRRRRSARGARVVEL